MIFLKLSPPAEQKPGKKSEKKSTSRQEKNRPYLWLVFVSTLIILFVLINVDTVSYFLNKWLFYQTDFQEVKNYLADDQIIIDAKISVVQMYNEMAHLAYSFANPISNSDVTILGATVKVPDFLAIVLATSFSITDSMFWWKWKSRARRLAGKSKSVRKSKVPKNYREGNFAVITKAKKSRALGSKTKNGKMELREIRPKDSEIEY